MWGGNTAGGVCAKLNALLSAGGSGGITGFKYINKTGNFSYTTKASGIVIGTIRGVSTSTTPSFSITKGSYLAIEREPTFDVYYEYIGFFTNGATINGNLDNKNDTIIANIFEFI